MKPVRTGYAVTLGMLRDGFEFNALTFDDADTARSNFEPDRSYGIDLAQRIQFLCNNSPEPEEVIEPTTPEIDEQHWYSHSALIAPTQTGKTNIIQWRLSQLLPQIAAGKASVVLMEPKGVLTRELLNLAQTWDMRERVVILDPADTPVSVNVFDRGDGSDQAINETVGRVSRVIGTLSTDFTGFQKDAITFAIRAMFALPEQPSISLLMRILRGGKAVLPLTQLPEAAREYLS